jgi:hypothetical protein
MAEEVKQKKEISGTGSLTGEALEAEDVLAGAEEWDPVETKLVLWSFVIAIIALIIGLLVVPTSVFN